MHVKEKRLIGAAAFLGLLVWLGFGGLLLRAGATHPANAFRTLTGPQVVLEAGHALSAPMRMLVSRASTTPATGRDDDLERLGARKLSQLLPFADPAMQAFAGPQVATTPGLNFDGLVDQSGWVVPDTNGAAGATQFVEWVNTRYAVYDKNTGKKLLGSLTGNTFWSGLGGLCQTNNNGDVIAQYDKVAARWVMTQHADTTGGPNFQCVAVSTTSDATGSFFQYAFSLPNTFPDYPKLAVWPDAYYLSINEEQLAPFADVGAYVCALDRNAMLAGQAASMQCFQQVSTIFSLLPTDLDGLTLPPAGSPNYFMNLGSNSLNLWKFHVDFVNPANTTFSGPTNIPVTSFSEACNGGICIPQSDTTETLDSLGDRLMYRLAYRNFGDHESIVATHSVVAGSSVGVRWYEIRSPGASPVIFQQGTFAPDSSYRWMGSMAMDRVGDIAVGYSVSSSLMHPAIRYTGRVPADPLGTLESETSIIEGTGSETAPVDRWGDYTSMSVDPVDDCTFWYSNEYLSADGHTNWRTRLASFSFASCKSADFSFSAAPPSQTVVQGSSTAYTATITPTAGFNPTVNLSVTGLPAGATSGFSPNPVSGSGSSTLTISTASSTPAGSFPLTVTGVSDNISHSAGVTLIVNPLAQTTTTLGSSLNPSMSGQSVTFTATITAASGTPTGTVTFSDGGNTLGTTALNSSGVATLAIATLSVGSHSITAGYSGDANFAPSTSAVLTQTVNPIGTGGGNPKPQLSMPLVPATTAPGGTAFTLTVNGTGFVSGATLNWNGSPRTTTVNSGKQISASILASDITMAGTATITVSNPAPGGGVSSPIFVSITTSTAGLNLTRSDLPTGATPLALAVADLNNDGKLDVVTANGNTKTVSVLLGKGDGTFQTHSDLVVPGFPAAIAIADFNNDGKPDLAVADAATGNVSILLGNGDGTFQAHQEFAVGADPQSMAVGDFNGDGNWDVVTANQTANTVSILLGNGDGTFQTHQDFATGSSPIAVAVGDFDGNGVPDLAVADNGSGMVSILLGKGDGTFPTHQEFTTNASPDSIAVADINGDSKLDLVVAESSGGISVLLGNGDGTFQTHTDYNAASQPQGVALADLNGDAVLDAAVANFSSNNLSILLGNSNGSFQTHQDFASAAGPGAVAFGDFNGDGRMDLVLADQSASTVSLFLQSPLAGVAPTSLTFASQIVGTTSPAQSVTLSNTGSAPLAISSIAISGANSGDFAQSNGCAALLPAGANCNLSVTFTPSAVGTRTASLTVTDNSAGSPQSVSLTGTGAGTPIVSLSSPQISFPKTVVGNSSAVKSVTLTNTGSGTLSITSIMTTGANAGDFVQTNTCGSSVAPAANCTISVTFAPTAAGSRTASVSITDDAAGSPQQVALSGTATFLTLAPGQLNFGTQTVGTTSAAKTETLTNHGTSPVTINSVAIIGPNRADFAQTNTCGASLAGLAKCTISVTFTPTATGSRSASLSISDSDPGSPQRATLAGTGQ